MSTIVLVRHAQASLFEADYDRLSDLGRQQARRLGQYLGRQGLAFDEVYMGPRRRHKQTAELVVGSAQESSPSPVEVAELDEHQVDQLATRHIDRIAEQFPELQELLASFRSADDLFQRQKSFARLFQFVTELWLSSRCPLFGVESWPEFNQRVEEGIDKIMAHGRQRSILVFTSAGPIVVALRRALQCSDEVALGLGWRIWNCSLTQFVFSVDRFSLDQFNTMPHLADRSEWTYR